MTVYKKLQAARLALVEAGVKKTGKNSFHGWQYYELGDFIPTVHGIFNTIGLCGIVTFAHDLATLTIYDTEDSTSIQFSTPVVNAENNKAQAIQLLGSTHTYIRRYLWLLAMEIVETDSVDSEKQEEKKEIRLKPPATMQGSSDGTKNDGPWFMRIVAEPDCTMEQWVTAVEDAAEVAMELAKSASDVTAIYAKNKEIFLKLKEVNKASHDDLVKKFSTAKQSFKG